MFRHYLIIGWRRLTRCPLYSLINILSLSIGVAACVLIALYVQYELRYDHFHANAEQIQVVETQLRPDLREGNYPYAPLWSTPPSLADALRREIPGALDVVRAIVYGNVSVEVDNNYFSEQITWADSNFFSFFSFPLAVGDVNTVLSDPGSAVISKETAAELFGSTDAIGRTFSVTNSGRTTRHRVSGILGDYPGNSTLKPRIVLAMSAFGLSGGWERDWINKSCRTFVRLPHSIDCTRYVEQINRWMDTKVSEDLNVPGIPSPMTVLMIPLTKVHLSASGSDRSRLVLLVCLAAAVLLIASTNFVTLSMARSLGRAREISMRKVFGAVRPQVLSQFWGESCILAAIAVGLGLVIAEIVLPIFNGLFGRHLTIDFLSNWLLFPVLVVLLVLLTLGAGSVPALVLAQLQPSVVLRKVAELKRKSVLSHTLVVIQLALSLVLLIYAAGVVSQLRYVKHKPLGFTKDHVVVVTNHATTDISQHLTGDEIAARLRTELAGDPGFRYISAVYGSFNKGTSASMSFPWKGGQLNTALFVVDEEYVPTLELKLLQGRNFSAERLSDRYRSVIVNESFIKAAGLSDPIGTPLPLVQPPDTMHDPVIIGVVKDFHSWPLTFAIEPAILRILPSTPKHQFLIKVVGDDYPAIISRIEQAWNRVTGGSRFEYSFLEDDIAAPYRTQERFLRIVSYSAGVALVVALMGLFGLAGLRAVNRMKEVSIRKVIGASVPNLLRMLNMEFVFLIGAANLIAWPIAYYLLNRWLRAFVYRVSLDIWPFVLAGAVTSLTAIAVVSFHTIKAASVNPSQILRRE
jgi:putative ABC transport system permease protein